MKPLGLDVTIPDWPLGGARRGPCRFWIEAVPGRGVRACRQTTGKPKKTTYGARMLIVEMDDGSTGVLEVSNPPYTDQVSLWLSNLQHRRSLQGADRDAALALLREVYTTEAQA